jgi:hypothetical protein
MLSLWYKVIEFIVSLTVLVNSMIASRSGLD